MFCVELIQRLVIKDIITDAGLRHSGWDESINSKDVCIVVWRLLGPKVTWNEIAGGNLRAVYLERGHRMCQWVQMRKRRGGWSIWLHNCTDISYMPITIYRAAVGFSSMQALLSYCMPYECRCLHHGCPQLWSNQLAPNSNVNIALFQNHCCCSAVC